MSARYGTEGENSVGTDESLIPKHGGYRNLKSFQIAQLVYDVTVRFCDRYIDKRSRTHDQMVQAAKNHTASAAGKSSRLNDNTCETPSSPIETP